MAFCVIAISVSVHALWKKSHLNIYRYIPKRPSIGCNEVIVIVCKLLHYNCSHNRNYEHQISLSLSSGISQNIFDQTQTANQEQQSTHCIVLNHVKTVINIFNIGIIYNRIVDKTKRIKSTEIIIRIQPQQIVQKKAEINKRFRRSTRATSSTRSRTSTRRTNRTNNAKNFNG